MSYWKLHQECCERGDYFYLDPDTGYQVFTAVGLKQRGKCCGSGCRHCPFDHEGVVVDQRGSLVKQPAWLTDHQSDTEPVDLLFWSSGKDSFLTLRALQKSNLRPIVLLTTFDVHSRCVAHQDVSIDDVIRQAEYLKLPLLGVPLISSRNYMDHIVSATKLVDKIARFVFGDLHLEHIRRWREESFDSLAEDIGASLYFPLWRVPYSLLLDDLEASGVICQVSAVTELAAGIVELGDHFNRAFYENLPSNIDAFGECGEFHTYARVWER